MFLKGIVRKESELPLFSSGPSDKRDTFQADSGSDPKPMLDEIIAIVSLNKKFNSFQRNNHRLR